jgi:hypothetical protein
MSWLHPQRRPEDFIMVRMRTVLSATATAAALLAITATVAHADDRQLFVWSGTVDREAVISMRGSRVELEADGFDGYRDARFRVREALPRAAGRVRVVRSDGRGEVEVIEQPSLFNGFTTRVRVRDRQSGADRYRLEAYWDGRGSDRDEERADDRYDDRYDDARNRGRGNGRGNGRFDDRNGRDRRNDSGIGDRRDAGTLRFSAVVDDVAEIRIQGRRVDFVSRSGRPLYDVRYDIRGASLPQYALPLDLRRLNGRGNVSIVQYPRAFNNWTAVIRIDDSRGGADTYDIDLRW